jgi:hypothetical protein
MTTASVVPRGHDSVLEPECWGGNIPAPGVHYRSAWTAQSGLGMVGDPLWASRKQRWEAACSRGSVLTVCVDVSLAF